MSENSEVRACLIESICRASSVVAAASTSCGNSSGSVSDTLRSCCFCAGVPPPRSSGVRSNAVALVA